MLILVPNLYATPHQVQNYDCVQYIATNWFCGACSPAPRTPEHLKRTWSVVYILHSVMKATEEYGLLGCCFSTVSSTNIFNSSKAQFTGWCPQSTPLKHDTFAITGIWQGKLIVRHFIWQLELPIESNHIMWGRSGSADEKWEQETAVFTSDIVPTAMWKGSE